MQSCHSSPAPSLDSFLSRQTIKIDWTLSTTGRLIFCFSKLNLMDSFIVPLWFQSQVTVLWWGRLGVNANFYRIFWVMFSCSVSRIVRKNNEVWTVYSAPHNGYWVESWSYTGGSNVCIPNANLSSSHDICSASALSILLPGFLTTNALKCIFIVGLEFVEFPFESWGYNRVTRVYLV